MADVTVERHALPPRLILPPGESIGDALLEPAIREKPGVILCADGSGENHSGDSAQQQCPRHIIALLVTTQSPRDSSVVVLPRNGLQSSRLDRRQSQPFAATSI
jgi:hypothetical protein